MVRCILDTQKNHFGVPCIVLWLSMGISESISFFYAWQLATLLCFRLLLGVLYMYSAMLELSLGMLELSLGMHALKFD